MERFIVLAGPTLDKALGLIRLGLITSKPSSMCRLEPAMCVNSPSGIASIREGVPDEIKPLLTPAESQPVHVFIADKNEAFTSRDIVHHVLSQTFPPGSFISLCDGVLVPSFELYFILRCRGLKMLSECLKLGMELCGTYSHLIPGDELSQTFYRLPTRMQDGSLQASWNSPRISQATNTVALATFAQQAKGVRGVCPARKAQRLLLDGSASPNESVLALMAALPCSLGGYGFKGVELNPKVPVKEELRHLVQVDAFTPDCFIRSLDLDLEYESNERHVSATAVAHDKARRNDIQALGIEVKDVTWEMLSRFDKLELLFSQVLHKEREMGLDAALGHARAVNHPDNVAKRALRLRELLPPWPYEG